MTASGNIASPDRMNPPRVGELLYRAYRHVENRRHKLLYLFLELTGKCNLACIHCGSDCSGQEAPEEMGLDCWKVVVDYVYDHFFPTPAITITGGEPLVLDWLGSLGAYIAGKGMRWGMVTNGILLDAGRLAALEAAGLESVTISMDGTEERHDRMRGKTGAWKSAMRGISILGRSSISVKDVVTCVGPGTIPELDDLATHLIEAGIRSWRLFRIFPRGRALAHPDLFLDRSAYLRLVEWLAAKRPILAKAGLDVSLSCDGWLPWNFDRRVRSFPFFCRSGINIASVLKDGTITGCPNNDKGFSQGNFFKDDFLQTWNDGFAAYRDRSWTRAAAGAECASCDAYAGCRGGSMHSWIPGSASPAQCWKIGFDAG